MNREGIPRRYGVERCSQNDRAVLVRRQSWYIDFLAAAWEVQRRSAEDTDYVNEPSLHGRKDVLEAEVVCMIDGFQVFLAY